MNPSSIKDTIKDYQGTPIAVEIKGLKRSWNVIFPRYTAIGVEFNDAHSCNGTLIDVTTEQLAYLDTREIGYNRVSIEHNKIHFKYANNISPFLKEDDQVFVYAFETKTDYREENVIFHPVYVNKIVAAVFSHPIEFAHDFVASTHWPKHILAKIEGKGLVIEVK